MAVTGAQLGDSTRLRDDALFAAHRFGDPAAREALVQRFLPLARKLAMRYSYTDEPLDDLIQVASIGLVKAIDRFDAARGHTFASFAVPTIVGELKRHFRDTGWSVHVPRALQERALAISREGDRLARELGRSPTLRELAAALDWPYDQVLEATEAAHSYHSASLDAPLTTEMRPASAWATRSAWRTATSASWKAGRRYPKLGISCRYSNDGSCCCASAMTSHSARSQR